MFFKDGGAGVGDRTENDKPMAWFGPSRTKLVLVTEK